LEKSSSSKANSHSAIQRVKISNRYEALENLDDNADTNMAWGSIKTEYETISPRESTSL
jgi:hypothetical protein